MAAQVLQAKRHALQATLARSKTNVRFLPSFHEQTSRCLNTICKGYYQCVPGTAATSAAVSSSKTSSVVTTKTTATTLVTSSKASASATASATTGGGVQCTGTFTPVSASAFVNSMNPGWNLGNTLDAVQSEGDWNNPKVTADTFDGWCFPTLPYHTHTNCIYVTDIKTAGYKGVRLPVTWACK